MRRGTWLLALGLCAAGVGTTFADDGTYDSPTDRNRVTASGRPQRPIHYFSRSGNTGATTGFADDVRDRVPPLESARRPPEGKDAPLSERYRRSRTEDAFPARAERPGLDEPLSSANSPISDRRRPPVEPLPGIRNYHDELFGESGAARRPAPRDQLSYPESPLRQVAHEERPAAQSASADAIEPAKRPSGMLPPGDDLDSDLGSRPIVHAEYEASPDAADAPIQPVAGEAYRGRLPAVNARQPIAPRDSALPNRPMAAPYVRDAAPRVPSPASQNNPQAQPVKPAVRETQTAATPRPAAAPPATAHTPANGSAGAPLVTVEWVPRTAINVGQECACELVVKNAGQAPAQEVVVEAALPESVRLVDAQPLPGDNRERLTWTFPTIAAGQTQSIHLKLIPTRRGEMTAEARVRFTGVAGGSFTVEEPLLRIAVTGPKEVMVGDPASQVIVVSNPGTGVADNVIIEAVIPAGLEHPRGERLAMEIGALNPGESRQVRLGLAAVGGGQQIVQVSARAGANLRETAQASIEVIAPQLLVSLDGPGLRYMGRSATYKLLVKNDGAAASNNVRLVHKVPAGFEFVSASHGGKFEAEDNSIHWFIGRMQPDEELVVTAQLTATSLGDFEHQIVATSEHGGRAEARLAARVEGSAALVLEIADLNDPVEVGTETGYEIRVHNEGSKAATNVGLSCELSPGVELIRAEGPSERIAESGLVVFKSLESLPAGKTAVYRVIVRGVSEGNHRFRARLASDSIQEPLIFEELTRFYGE